MEGVNNGNMTEAEKNIQTLSDLIGYWDNFDSGVDFIRTFCRSRGNGDAYHDLITMAHTFFSQPFTTDMLVNGVEKPPEGVPLLHEKMSWNIAKKTYQQAEQQRMFDGWGLSGKSFFARYQCAGGVYRANKQGRGYVDYISDTKSLNVPKPKTLNDFISDCQRAEIPLQPHGKKWEEIGINEYLKP